MEAPPPTKDVVAGVVAAATTNVQSVCNTCYTHQAIDSASSDRNKSVLACETSVAAGACSTHHYDKRALLEGMWRVARPTL